MPKIPQILVFSLNMHFSRIRSKLLALLQPGVNILCTRANAVAGVVQPSFFLRHPRGVDVVARHSGEGAVVMGL